MPPLAPPVGTVWSPWEARATWHDAALLLAMVLAPEALAIVEAELGHERRHARRRDEAPAPRSRRVGRRPGVRPPRSC